MGKWGLTKPHPHGIIVIEREVNEMDKPIAEMTEDELYERMNVLYNRRAEIVKELRAIDDEAYKIEFKLMGGM